MFRYFEEERSRRNRDRIISMVENRHVNFLTNFYVKDMMRNREYINQEMIATFRSSVSNGNSYKEAKIKSKDYIKIGHETRTQDRPDIILINLYENNEISQEEMLNYGEFLGLEIKPKQNVLSNCNDFSNYYFFNN